MRIAHVITRMILGGAQENTLLNCRDLIHLHGDEVLLITGPAEGPEGSLLERARAENVPLAIVPDLIRSISPWHDARAYFAVGQAIAEFRPDVVHTHSAKGGVIGRIAAWRLGVPAVVHTVHGAPFYPAQNWAMYEFSRWAEWLAARHCHALISVADAMTDLLVAAGVAPREKFTTIYSGMETEPFLAADQHRAEMRRRLGYSDGQVVIGKIARLFELKGHDDVVTAARDVVARHPQVRFLFVGDGALRDELQRQIDAAGLRDHFQFTGLVPPAEIPGYLSAMDVVVHTSLREGLARVLPQGLLAGKPVVSYDIDGAREVVNQETGYLLPAGDVTGLVAALETLIADPALRQRLGNSRRAQLATQFGHEQMTARIRALYERVLTSS